MITVFAGEKYVPLQEVQKMAVAFGEMCDERAQLRNCDPSYCRRIPGCNCEIQKFRKMIAEYVPADIDKDQCIKCGKFFPSSELIVVHYSITMGERTYLHLPKCMCKNCLDEAFEEIKNTSNVLDVQHDVV